MNRNFTSSTSPPTSASLHVARRIRDMHVLRLTMNPLYPDGNDMPPRRTQAGTKRASIEKPPEHDLKKPRLDEIEGSSDTSQSEDSASTSHTTSTSFENVVRNQDEEIPDPLPSFTKEATVSEHPTCRDHEEHDTNNTEPLPVGGEESHVGPVHPPAGGDEGTLHGVPLTDPENAGPDVGPVNHTQLLDVSIRPYFHAELVERLNHLVTYTNATNACYAIHELPANNLYWPPSRQSRDDKSDFMHIDCKLVLVWFVGEVILPRFAKGESHARKPGLLFRPVLQADLNRANKILRENSMPRRVENDSDEGLWIGKWVANNSVPDARIPPFVDVFDGTSKIKQKAQMTRLDVHDLKPHDLVLIEAMILRWPLERGEERIEFYKTRNWKTWRTEYKLDAIYLLFPGSTYMDEKRPGEDVEL
ncbi:hypothetical protein NM688_g552 [Phlebia brevispora]|uniref:Uncharacterized protein n=1 Tax=Phlebia brevispora TaxID=194682 RepID=A0ACC1TDQ2_9APHY|nr:hypothetical protein NM688_g552 [Phlebia brevispora]